MKHKIRFVSAGALLLVLILFATCDLFSTDDGSTGLTVAVTEGPYYISGTSELTDKNLNYTNLSGTAITISGHVYEGASGTTAISGAKIEIWHADDDGDYHPNSNGSASNYDESELALRGYVMSASDGSYSFTTIYPGYYEGRCRHIHIKISADGYTGVTSQLIMYPKAGDGITYSTDSIAQSLPSYQRISIDETVSPGTGTFDIRLAKQ